MLPYPIIYGWSAKRAGGHITVYGTSKDGHPLRVTNVDTLCAASSSELGTHALAIRSDGARYRLVA